MKEFEDKVAVVTGAAEGIGRASAIRLALGGATVVVLDRQKSNETVVQITEIGGKSVLFQVDLSNRSDVETVFGRLEELYGGGMVRSQTPPKKLGTK